MTTITFWLSVFRTGVEDWRWTAELGAWGNGTVTTRLENAGDTRGWDGSVQPWKPEMQQRMTEWREEMPLPTSARSLSPNMNVDAVTLTPAGTGVVAVTTRSVAVSG